jgi:Putative peptidoglycan binding domain
MKVVVVLLGAMWVGLAAPAADARQGCCSHHGGVCAQQCCDGTPLSAKCGGGTSVPSPGGAGTSYHGSSSYAPSYAPSAPLIESPSSVPAERSAGSETYPRKAPEPEKGASASASALLPSRCLGRVSSRTSNPQASTTVRVCVQLALKQASGYTGKLDGSMGPASEAALKAFQKDHGLDVTGVIDMPTLVQLGIAKK